MFGLTKKKHVDRPTDKQKNFISKGQATMNWWLNHDLDIQKWVFRILLIALGVWILVAVIMGLVYGFNYYNQLQPQAQASLGAVPVIVITIIIYSIFIVLWFFLLSPFLHLLNSATVFFKNLGGQGIIWAIVKDQNIATTIGIFFGIAGIIFIICIAIRGIRLATARNAEQQEGIKRNTAMSIFGAVLGLFLMTACFIFATGLVSFFSDWIVQNIGGNVNTNIGCFVLNYSQWEGIGHITEIPAVVDPSQFSLLAITLLGVAAAIFLMKFIIGAISAIFKMIVLFITSFVALAKWPQDEGGTFMGHKDDLIGVFFNFILLYLLFNLFMVLISAIAPIAGSFPTSQNFLMPAVVGCSLFAAGAVAMTSLSKRLPELFSLKRNVGSTITTGESVSKVVGGAGRKVERTVLQTPGKAHKALKKSGGSIRKAIGLKPKVTKSIGPKIGKKVGG